MTATIHLTNDIQAELNRIGSRVRLLTDNNSVIKLNYKDWAWADINFRQIQATTFIGIDDKHLQLEEKGITACTSSTKNITALAVIIDKWLDKQLDIFQIANEHPTIKIDEDYLNLKTLDVDKNLELRWASIVEEIAKGSISFRQDVFEEIRKHFSFLFPFFSHDNLWFSNILELPNDDFKSPTIYCDKDTIWVGFFSDNSEQERKKTYKTKDIKQAIQKINELLPKGKLKTTNPLTN